MKKIIAAVMALSMLGVFAGCSKADKADTDAEAIDSAVESAAEEIEKKIEDAAPEEKATEAAAETTEAQTEAAPEAETDVATDGEAKLLTAELMKNISSWDKGNIIIDMSVEEEGMLTQILMNTYDGKVSMYMNISGFMETTTVFDGEYTYMIDTPSKCYSREKSDIPDVDDSAVEDMLIDEEMAKNVTETGTKTIEGAEYSYEKFSMDGEEMTYYFDKYGNVRFIGTEADGKDILMQFAVDLLEAPDTSAFEIPSDYTEVSSEEIAMKMFAGLFSAMEEASEDE